jgi:hypothetical protein
MAQVQSASALMPATNPSLLSNPDYMQQMLQTQRTQALAQALTDQGLAPVEYDPRGRISPWQGVNKLASALLGGYEAQQAMKGQASLQSQAVQSNLQQYGAGQTPQNGSVSRRRRRSSRWGKAPRLGASGRRTTTPAAWPRFWHPAKAHRLLARPKLRAFRVLLLPSLRTHTASRLT